MQRIVSENGEGETLEKFCELRGGKIDEATVVQIGLQIAYVLKEYHTMTPSVIHRNMEPKNIIRYNDGSIKLVNFGAARRYVLEERFPNCHIYMDKGYNAPEQYRGQEDCRTDIYSLGMILYWLVTGKKPNEITYEFSLDEKRDKKVHKGFEYVISKCIEKDPNMRYQSCEELIYDLKNYKKISVFNSIIRKVFRHK